MVWTSDAVSAAEEHLDVAPNGQCTVDLEGNGAASRSRVVVPESKGGCVHQCVAIVPIHVTEPANTLMPARPCLSCSRIARCNPTSSVRGHEKVPTGGQVAVPGGGQ
jgi:hypothetical protein